MNRYKAEPQGSAKILWNVIDTHTSTFALRLSTQREATKTAKRLNEGEKKRKFWKNVSDVSKFFALAVLIGYTSVGVAFIVNQTHSALVAAISVGLVGPSLGYLFAISLVGDLYE